MSPDDLDDPPLPSLMQRTGVDPLHNSISRFNGTEDANDFYSEHKRRERAYMWHRRWAMPTRQMMEHQIKTTPGLDITLEDLDLLPWGQAQQLNNAEYHRLQSQGLRQHAQRKRQQSLEKDDPVALEAAAQTTQQAQEAERARMAAEAEQERAAAAKQKAAKKAQEARAKAAQEAARRKAEEQAARRAREEEKARLNAQKERLLAQQAEEEARQRRQAEEAARLAAREQRRASAPAVTKGTSAVERAYRWYDLLETPTKENMVQGAAKGTNMDIDANDINALPWNDDGTAIDFPRLHDLMEQVLGHAPLLKSEMSPCTPVENGGKKKVAIDTTGLPSTPKSILSSPVRGGASSTMKQVTFTPRSTKGTLSPKSKKSHLWNALDEEERLKRKAFGWYLTLHRPSRAVMEDVIANSTGVGVSEVDVARLPWETANQSAFVQEALMVLPSMFGEQDEEKRQRQVARRAKEDAARAKEAAELEEWKMAQAAAPEVPAAHVTGDVATAYRWYRTLGGPTKETFQAVLAETQGVPITKEQLETLPWTQHDRVLDHALLTELLQEEVAAAEATRASEAPMDPRMLEAILQAYREYKELGIPKFITFSRMVDEIDGLETAHDDVSLLPWDEDGLYVEEGRISELQRRLQDHMAQQNLQEAAKRKRAEARKKRLEAAARKQKEKEREDERRRSGEYGGEDGSGKKKHKDVPIYLKERMGLRELEFTKAKEKGDKNKWEESRALKAYAWYTRMSGPNRTTLKRIVASMKEGCDVVPDDIDLLPWSASGGWVDHIKMDELSRRWKDIVN